MAKQIAYHTTDEVPLESAARAARECAGSSSRSPDLAAQPEGPLVRALRRASDRPPVAPPDPEGRDAREAPEDLAVLCEMVRSLAAHAQRALHRRPDATPDEIGDLRARIEQLQRHLDRFRRQGDLGLEDLWRWVDSLGRRVEGLLARSPREAEESSGEDSHIGRSRPAGRATGRV